MNCASCTLLQQSRERDERELSILSALTTVLQITHGYSAPETVEVSTRARALNEKVGNVGNLVLQAMNRWAVFSSAGNFIAARRIAEETFEIASREGNPANLAYAHMAIMTSRYRLGDLIEAEHYFESGRAFFDSKIFRRTPGLVPQTFGNASRIALLMGRADTARDRISEAVSAALDTDSPYDQAFAHFMAAMLHLMLREPQKALDSATSSLKLCDKHKFSQFAALSRIALGRACAELDDAHEGVELIRRGMAEMLATRNRNGISACLHWLSEAQMLGGEIKEAIESIDKAINEEPTHLFFRPENLRLPAELRLKQGNTELAEMGFRESIAVARRMVRRPGSCGRR
jgi:tetratricopeptide (TPR) repeat protein